MNNDWIWVESSVYFGNQANVFEGLAAVQITISLIYCIGTGSIIFLISFFWKIKINVLWKVRCIVYYPGESQLQSLYDKGKGSFRISNTKKLNLVIIYDIIYDTIPFFDCYNISNFKINLS